MALRAVAQLSNISGAFQTRAVTGDAVLLPTDNIVYVNQSSGSGCTLTLPASPVPQQQIIIKDIAGNASTKPITISGTVDGVTNPVIGANYGGAWLSYNGSGWSEHA